MKSECLFTNYDLLDYKDASIKAVTQLNNILNIFCRDKSYGFMVADRIKSLDSIHEKIEKKMLEKGDDFNLKVHVSDIAGLRVIFCDKNYICPDVELLDYNIHCWSPNEFEYAFEDSKLHEDNYNVSNLYEFVDFLMKNVPNVDIVKDYIMYQKPSGYQGIHVIINVSVNSYDGTKKQIPVEIQFRNFTQHLYNECEHDVRYKKINKNPDEYADVFNTAKRFLLSEANEAYIEILDECERKNKTYFLIRNN